MYEYFQASDNSSPTMDRQDQEELMEPAINNESNTMNDQQLSCKAALQDAMDKCLLESSDNVTMNNEFDESIPTDIPDDNMTNDIPEQPVTNDLPEETVTNDIPEEPVLNDVVEGFENMKDNKSYDRMSLLINVFIMMTVFFLLSHYDTAKFLTKTFKGLKGQSLHLVITLLFGIVYLILTKYL